MPGAVEIFTSRGKRQLLVNTGTKDMEAGLLLPLPAYPGKAQRAWSEWLPRVRAGSPALPDGLRYRFRIVKRVERIRSQVVGAFTVETVARSLTPVAYNGESGVNEADADFVVRYRGAPVTIEGHALDHYIPDPWKREATPSADSVVRYNRLIAVAVISGEVPALVVEADDSDDRFRFSYDYLLQPEGDRLRTTFVSASHGVIMAQRLSAPPADDSGRTPIAHASTTILPSSRSWWRRSGQRACRRRTRRPLDGEPGELAAAGEDRAAP